MSPLKVTVEDVEHGQITVITGGIIRTFRTGPREVVTAVDELQELAREGVAGATGRAFLGKDDVAAAAEDDDAGDRAVARGRTAYEAWRTTIGAFGLKPWENLTTPEHNAWMRAAAAVAAAVRP